MNHYPRHIGDWRTATYNLTRVQRSIYSDLIDDYYDKERPLTADFERLAQDQGCNTPEDRVALRYILDRYFILDGEVYRHERCDEEIAHFHHIIEVGRRAGKASASARAERKGNAGATPVQRKGNAGSTTGQPPNTQDPRGIQGSASPREVAQAASPPAPHEPPHEQNGGLSDRKAEGPLEAKLVVPPPHIPEPTQLPGKVSRPSKKCPKDFEVTGPMLQWAITELGLEESVIKRETDKFRDHTFSRAITDWMATWRNWMRKAAEFVNHRSHQKGGVGAVLERKQQTESFMAAVKGAGNATSRTGAFDVESRVVRDGEELPPVPRD